jgi:hypothetical protein
VPEKPIQELRDHLRSWAEQLTADSLHPPVLVGKICTTLGVDVAKRESVPLHKAYLSVDPTRERPALILLPVKQIGSFERFCIAHELAHYLLILGFSATPRDENEYWKHEELCDDFARHLLVPARHLDMAHRISEFRSDVIYSRCERSTSDDFKFVATTHPRQKGRGKLVKRESKLWGVFDGLLGRAKQSNRIVRAELTDDFLNEGLNEFLGYDEKFSVVAEVSSGRFADIKIAISA